MKWKWMLIEDRAGHLSFLKTDVADSLPAVWKRNFSRPFHL